MLYLMLLFFGIFREILMTASANIKTPSMDLPVKPGKKSRKHAKHLQRKFTKVTLAQVSHTVSILLSIYEIIHICTAGCRWK